MIKNAKYVFALRGAPRIVFEPKNSMTLTYSTDLKSENEQ